MFEPGEPRFWDDLYISKGMLQAHLNPDNDLASRKHKTIDKEVNHLVSLPGLGTDSVSPGW